MAVSRPDTPESPVEFTFPSATGTGDIYARAFLPKDPPAAVLVIHHGMAEHQERYLPFLRFLNGHGIAAYIHDMAGHGKSVHGSSSTGWFGEKDGWKALTADFHTLVLRAADDFPGVPLFVMGHSMGSFICRAFCAMYPLENVRGAIFMGTGGPNAAAAAGKAVASLLSGLMGKHHRSRLMEKMAFGTYNRRFEGRTSFDWLTRDTSVVDRYIADPNCGFLFTVQGMHDLVSVNEYVNSPEWFRKIPAGLPILLVSGAEDPVGDYGAGVRKVSEMLLSTGHTRTELVLWPEARHEVLNELSRAQVMDGLLSWLEACLSGKG